MKLIYPNNINKYFGDIIEEDNQYIYSYKLHKSVKNKTKKYFKFSNENEKKIALDNIIKYKKQFSINNNKCMNVYSYNTDGSISVHFRNNNIMLIDKDDIDLLNDFVWKLRINNVNGDKKIIVNTEICRNTDFSKYYSYLNKITPNRNFDKLKRYKSITFIFLKYGGKKYITFKNKNVLDFRLSNIINNTYKIYKFNNIINIDNKNYKINNLYKNEKYWEVKGKLNNKIVSRKFYINKFGNLIAKELANEFKQRLLKYNYTIV